MHCGRSLCALLGIALSFAMTTPALAHSFTVAFVAPCTGAKADLGTRSLRGFLLAAGERDAHPDEVSDGHLGGLDVYVLEVDSGAGSGHPGTWVGAPGSDRPDFVTGPGAGEVALAGRFAGALAALPDAISAAAGTPRRP